ncbi:MAG TPA: AAA family ATPase [Actinomycetospora sp.]|uniref:AAA family ATPase n=1 Tax=Actinomycetospora sp. TaxID=1872135 RepID=UPI002F402080
MVEALVPGGVEGVGRAGELTRLLEVARQARAGPPPPVLITGPAGIGKSELVDRLRRRVGGSGSDAGAETMTVVRAVAPGEGPSRPGALLESCLAAARAAGAAAAAVPPEMPDGLSPRSASALLAAFDELDDARPVLFVADDLHRADPESLGVLRRLLRRLHPLRVMAVLVGHDRPDDWLEPPSGDAWPLDTVRMTLRGLTVDEITDLANEVDPDVTTWSARRLREETDDNPMYVRAVLADGGLSERYRLGRPRPPGSLVTSLRRRLARLPAAPREALEALAVVGAPAPVRLLRALTGRDTVSEDCAPLVREGLLEAQVDETDEILAYRSALARDAVYGSLPAARRRGLHGRVARLVDGPARWRHLVGSTDGPDAGLADDLEQAATTEFERGALVTAAEYLQWASARSPDAVSATRRLTEAVRLLVYAAREGTPCSTRASSTISPTRRPARSCSGFWPSPATRSPPRETCSRRRGRVWTMATLPGRWRASTSSSLTCMPCSVQATRPLRRRPARCTWYPRTPAWFRSPAPSSPPGPRSLTGRRRASTSSRSSPTSRPGRSRASWPL